MTEKLTWYKSMPDGTVRYYVASIQHDLFDLIVYCDWGTVGTRLGGSKSYVAKDQSPFCGV